MSIYIILEMVLRIGDLKTNLRKYLFFSSLLFRGGDSCK